MDTNIKPIPPFHIVNTLQVATITKNQTVVDFTGKDIHTFEYGTNIDPEQIKLIILKGNPKTLGQIPAMMRSTVLCLDVRDVFSGDTKEARFKEFDSFRYMYNSYLSPILYRIEDDDYYIYNMNNSKYIKLNAQQAVSWLLSHDPTHTTNEWMKQFLEPQHHEMYVNESTNNPHYAVYTLGNLRHRHSHDLTLLKQISSAEDCAMIDAYQSYDNRINALIEKTLTEQRKKSGELNKQLNDFNN